ncbi:hypothetical protein C9974_07610 [Marinobacter sp. B9-2]|nr:hypothetical protein C9974_07610 [Marinobacter sp. B9-2]
MKRVGIYVEAATAKQKTGISSYVIGLVNALLRENKNIIFYLYYRDNLFYKHDLNWLVASNRVRKRPIWFPISWIDNHPRIWWDFYLPLRIWLDRIDIFHGPNHMVPSKTKVPCVVTIHDLAYFYMEVHGYDFDRYLRRLTLKSMSKAVKVIAISESTARDCVQQGFSKRKIATIYQGFERTLREKIRPNNFSDIPDEIRRLQPFLLSLGTIQPRKNIPTLIKAFGRVSKLVSHNLVLAGAPGSDQGQVDDLIRSLGLEDRVFCLGYINQHQKVALYRLCDIFVYPSLYEGFGLVILEAMSFGVPVITGDNSSLPEAAGDAAVLVDVSNCEHLANAILDLIFNQTEKDRLVKNGYLHIQKFAWSKAAQETIGVYQEVFEREGFLG